MNLQSYCGDVETELLPLPGNVSRDHPASEGVEQLPGRRGYIAPARESVCRAPADPRQLPLFARRPLLTLIK